MKTLIIDADTIIYRASTVVEEPTKWDERLWTLHADLDNATYLFERGVNMIRKDLGPTNPIIMALSCEGPRFRNDVMESYKGGRAESRKPVVYGPLRAYVKEVYDTYERPTLEGDDIVGILMTSDKIVKGDKIGVGIDKDLLTIPGVHYNYSTGTLSRISEETADRNHMLQTLTGDTTDGYPGCPGIGPKRAEKILDQEGYTWPDIVASYVAAGQKEESALANARVARICRASDYDFKKKEVILWSPPAP